MEKENKIIFYTELLAKIEKENKIKTLKLHLFEDVEKEIKNIKNEEKIEIWGATASLKHKNKEILSVNDHINFSGNNPLIGNQKKIITFFPDMSNIYKKTKKGITTTTRGKYFLLDDKYEYQTQYFSYFGIIARALGIKKIKGFLINQKINNLKKHIVAKN